LWLRQLIAAIDVRLRFIFGLRAGVQGQPVTFLRMLFSRGG
jgi:hypothetical protein